MEDREALCCDTKYPSLREKIRKDCVRESPEQTNKHMKIFVVCLSTQCLPHVNMGIIG
jgi:hypothetical protein